MTFNDWANLYLWGVYYSPKHDQLVVARCFEGRQWISQDEEAGCPHLEDIMLNGYEFIGWL